jgi:Mrp family chromosome partitioning ATPase/capsular polysaccharide biosynthesis protein
VRGSPNGFPEPGQASDLRWYVGVLWRRKFVVLPLLVVLPLVAYLRADPGETTYDASATVLLNRQSQGVSEIGDPTLWDPGRTIRTQAQLARLPEVASRVVEASGLPGRDAGGFLASSSVGSDEENDFLVFHVRDADPAIATRLANVYATKYIEYRSELDTQSLREAQQQLTEQLEQLRQQGVPPTANAYQSLITRQQQLKTAETLQASKSLLVRPAEGAGLVGTQERRTVFLALGLGLILSVGLAFIVEALDTRVRSVDELVRMLALPLLGTIPPPARRLRTGRKLVMLDEPDDPAAEPYRMLRASLEMAKPADCRIIMVTSAVEAEGKSTTAANLAVAMARAGQNVVLVDLDLYRPGLERWFRLPPRPGLTEAASGKVQLEDALRPVSLRSVSPVGLALAAEEVTVASLNGHRREGKLELLTRGGPPDSPGEFIATPDFQAVLDRIRKRAEVVIVDGPPLLLSGDGLMLSSRLDALLVLARVNILKEREVKELERILSSCPAAKLGLVVTGAASSSASGYYYRYRVREIRQPQRQVVD